jgi:lysophospholipase L1-like esterase
MKRITLALAALLFAMMLPNDTFSQDWPALGRFRESNRQLGPPAPGEKRVVFMGNSITEAWEELHPSFFKGKPYIDRGISGQTSPQMLLRFRADVIDLKPAVVLILAGTNDIAGNTGPSSLEMILDNIKSMTELAEANGIRVVLCSVLPANKFPWSPGIKPAGLIIRLNDMIRDYAHSKGLIYLDYYKAMVDNRKGLPKSLSDDGVHPTVAGYEIMESLAEKAITAALRLK